MKEFIEKLIGRLEELIDKSFNESINGYPFSFSRNSAYQEVMTIVNQLAEEYNKKDFYEITLNGCDDDTCFVM